RARAGGRGAGCDSASRRCGAAPLPVRPRCSARFCRRATARSSLRASHPASWRSKRDLRSIGWKLPAGALSGSAFFGFVKQRRIRVVDMQEYLPLDAKAIERCDRTSFARHRDMSHALPGLVTETGLDQLIVPPHRAVEEHQRCALQPRFKVFSDRCAGGKEIKEFARGLVADAQAERIARAVLRGRMRLAFEIPRALAGHLKGQDFDAARCTVRQRWLEGMLDLDSLAAHRLFVEHVEDA